MLCGFGDSLWEQKREMPEAYGANAKGGQWPEAKLSIEKGKSFVGSGISFRSGSERANACVKLNTQNYFKVNIQPDKNVSDAWSQGTELIYARARDCLLYTSRCV